MGHNNNGQQWNLDLLNSAEKLEKYKKKFAALYCVLCVCHDAADRRAAFKTGHRGFMILTEETAPETRL